MRSLLLIAFVVAACSESPPPTQEVTLGPLTFSVTADWQRKDTSKPGWASSMFTPSDNSRFESVTVVRSRRSDSKNMTLEQLLTSAQRGLRDVKISGLRAVKTASGLKGAEVSVSFKPEGMTGTYRRTHVVLAETDKTLVHILYTAKVPDEQERTLHVVLDSTRVDGQGGRS